jgi:hypothetical protein
MINATMTATKIIPVHIPALKIPPIASQLLKVITSSKMGRI